MKIRARIEHFLEVYVIRRCRYCGGPIQKESDGMHHFYHFEGCPFMERLLVAHEMRQELNEIIEGR